MVSKVGVDETKSLFPRASKSFIDANPQLFATQRERSDVPPLESEVPGQGKSDARPVLSIKCFRVRLLDKDNLYAGTKSLTDCIREIGLVSGDTEAEIDIQVSQEKVAHYREQRTEVKITYP